MSLVAHCGANLVEREQVLATIAPPRTDTWRPIDHSILLDLATDSIHQVGLNVVSEAHALTPNGHRYFGLLEIQNDAQDFNLVVGLRNSTDKSISAGLVLGSHVFVCDNLSFSGEIVIKHKHTNRILDFLPGLVHDAVGKTIEYKGLLNRRLESYKTTELSDSQAEHGIVELIRRGIVAPSSAGKVVQEWDHPRHPEFAEDKNVWRLFNAVTEINKGRQIACPARDYRLHNLLEEFQEAA
ncbi:MAG: hypothetical protein ACWGQW_05630 [bacterium]